MRQSILTIKNYKLTDLICQLVALLIAGWCIKSIGFFSLYIIALAQIISSIYWAYNSEGYPRLKNRDLLQKIFFILPLPLVLLAVFNLEYFTMASIFIMMWLGPILGIWYFILTINEFHTYRSMAYKASFR